MNLNYLFAAYTLIWLALFVFMWRLATKIKSLEQQVRSLRERQPKAKA
jgi:CcmD family protein